jgi:hypothetical protein
MTLKVEQGRYQEWKSKNDNSGRQTRSQEKW